MRLYPRLFIALVAILVISSTVFAFSTLSPTGDLLLQAQVQVSYDNLSPAQFAVFPSALHIDSLSQTPQIVTLTAIKLDPNSTHTLLVQSDVPWIIPATVSAPLGEDLFVTINFEFQPARPGIYEGNIYFSSEKAGVVIVPVSYRVVDAPSASSGSSSSGGGGGGFSFRTPSIQNRDSDPSLIAKEARVKFSNIQRNDRMLKIKVPRSSQLVVDTIDLELYEVNENIAAKIIEYSGRPSTVSAVTGYASYTFLDISLDNVGHEQIESAKVHFLVERSWLEENSIDHTTMVLHKWIDRAWTPLVTNHVSEDPQFIHYEAKTPGFSIFAITARKKSTHGLHIISPVDLKLSPTTLRLLPIVVQNTGLETLHNVSLVAGGIVSDVSPKQIQEIEPGGRSVFLFFAGASTSQAFGNSTLRLSANSVEFSKTLDVSFETVEFTGEEKELLLHEIEQIRGVIDILSTEIILAESAHKDATQIRSLINNARGSLEVATFLLERGEYNTSLTYALESKDLIRTAVVELSTLRKGPAEVSSNSFLVLVIIGLVLLIAASKIPSKQKKKKR